MDTDMTVPEEDSPVDWQTYVHDDFRDQLFRSREVRASLWGLRGKATAKIAEILDMETDEKTMATQLKAAIYVHDANIVPMPEVSYRTIEAKGSMTHKHEARALPPVSKEELLEATRNAMRSESSKAAVIEAEMEEVEGVPAELDRR